MNSARGFSHDSPTPPRRFRPARQLGAALLGLGLASAVPAAEPTPAKAGEISFEHDVTPLLKKYCYDCHGDGAHKAGLALDDFQTLKDVHGNRKAWEAVLRNVSRHEMPPEDAIEFPTQEEREVISQFVERELFQLDPAHPDPGRITLRRMNRAEYNNAIRDLVGVDFNPAADFPPDDSGYGFDNIGDVLSLPPVLMEKYLAAADKVLDQAIVTEPIQSRVTRVPASLATVGFNAIGDRGDGWVHLISLEEDDVSIELPIVAAGDYIVRFQAFSTKTGGALVGQGSEKPVDFNAEPPATHAWIAVNDSFVKDFVITPDEANPGVYEARIGVASGRQRFRAVVRRKRGGQNELTMLNGRLGTQQPGIVFVKWIEVEGPLPAATRRFPAAKLASTGEGRVDRNGTRVLESNGEVSTEIEVPHDGEFVLRAQGYADQAGTEPARMEFRIDGKPIQSFDVIAPATMQPLPRQRVFSLMLLVPQPEIYEVRTKLPAGKHRFSAAFVNDFTDPQNENPNLRDRNLYIQHLEVCDTSSPVLTPPIPAPLNDLFVAHRNAQPAEAARGILGDFARLAWRRPVQPSELTRLERLYALAREQGDSFEAGVKLGIKAALVSPNFVFVGDTTPAKSAEAQPIDEFSLASRLSFFLWSSVPDRELLGLAERGELRRNLDAQVRRMLASPKAHALVENFGGQWLQIRSLETMQPDKTLFPDFDPALRTAMQRETELFFEYVMREDRSLFDFLTGDYTFVNSRLAKFYGLPEVRGEEFQKVSLVGTPRRGVVTQASVLTLTSNPTRTSPVKRGKWVLENLLGTPPPPPPPNVPELDDKGRKLTGTLRQQLEQHRENPTCASCHARMDPIGFGFENFNAIGAWRDKDGDAEIDPAGTLASGDAFAGALDLSKLLAQNRAQDFRRCLAEKMLTYALGRGVEFYDRPAIEKIMEAVKVDGDRFSSLILAVAHSFPFQYRRGENRQVALASTGESAP
jgi:hypothetical protein